MADKNSHVGKPVDVIPWLERFPGYRYYDTPDGEDCLKKLVAINKLALFLGVSASTLDVVMYSKPMNFSSFAARYAYITFPVMAVASTFSVTSCLLTTYRGDKDTHNYFAGGFAAGCVAGAIARNGILGTTCAVLFGSVAYVRKSCDLAGLSWSGTMPPHNLGNIWAIKLNHSMYEEKPRGWKKSADEVLPTA